jgi:hypothetical protein
MSKYIEKVERCSFLISRSVKCVTRTGNLLLLISSSDEKVGISQKEESDLTER